MEKQDLVGYEIVLKSFCDANGDGVGDFRGVTSKLSYLKELGINAIWLSPFHTSPQVDSGYDVADYYGIEAQYGTMEDLQDLIHQAHARGISVLMDLVLNHTSSQNEWFKKSCCKEVGYEDFYIWTKQPNNWISFMGESVWTYVKMRDEYYLHIFSKDQPDLNYTNPHVLQTMIDVANFYLKLGIDGFRLDAVAHLAKDMTLADSAKCAKGEIDTVPFSNRDEVMTYLHEWKKGLCKDCILIGEVGGEVSAERSLAYLNRQNGVMDWAFTFDHCWLNGMYGKVVSKAEEDCTLIDSEVFIENYLRYYNRFGDKANMMLFWLNHDQPRLINQYGSHSYKEQSARMLATLLYFLYGAMFLYYGEEIGMMNEVRSSIEEFHDLEAHNFYHTSKLSKKKKLYHLNRMNRDVARGQMDWERAKRQCKEKASLWSEYQRIIQFRQSHLNLIQVPNVVFKDTPQNVVEYVREGKDETLHVVVNVSAEEITFRKCDFSGGSYITGKAWSGEKLPPYYYGAYYTKK